MSLLARAGKLFGLPADIGRIFDASSRKKLLLSYAVMLLQVGFEALGIVLMVPLIAILGGAAKSTSSLPFFGSLFAGWSRDQLVISLLAAVLIVVVLKGIVTMAAQWWMSNVVARLEISTSARLLKFYLSAPYTMHKEKPNSDFLRNLNMSVSQVYSAFVGGWLSLGTEVVTGLVITSLVFVAIPEAALVISICFLGIAVIYYRLTRKYAKRLADELLENQALVYQSSHTALGGVRDVILRGSVDRMVEDYESLRIEQALRSRTLRFVNQVPHPLFEGLFMGVVALIAWVVFLITPPGQATEAIVTSIGISVVAGVRLLPTVTRSLGAMGSIRAGRVALDYVLEDLREEERTVAAYSSIPRTPLRLHNNLQVKDLTYYYPGDKQPAFSNVNFTLPAGQSLGIVGLSGIGKSTLFDVLMGFMVPTSGQILVDGEDLSSRLEDWRETVGMVPQSPFFEPVSMVRNVAFGNRNREIDEPRIREALSKAHMDPVIARFNNGIYARVGQDARRLSGGERQRLALARALYVNPSVLFLDEATASVDGLMEQKLTEAVQNLRGEVTVLIVAHRLSTVKHCDQVLFMQKDRCALGTFAELSANNEDFAELVAAGALA